MVPHTTTHCMRPFTAQPRQRKDTNTACVLGILCIFSTPVYWNICTANGQKQRWIQRQFGEELKKHKKLKIPNSNACYFPTTCKEENLVLMV